MATDIVEQCRGHAAAFGAGGIASSLAGIFREAADEIEALQSGYLKSIRPENANKLPSEYLNGAEKAALIRAQERNAALA